MLFVVEPATIVVPEPVGPTRLSPPFSLNTGESPKTFALPSSITRILALVVRETVSGILQSIPAVPLATGTLSAIRFAGSGNVEPSVENKTLTVDIDVPVLDHL